MGKFTRLTVSLFLATGSCATASAQGFIDAAAEKPQPQAMMQSIGAMREGAMRAEEAVPTVRLTETKATAVATPAAARSARKAPQRLYDLGNSKIQMNFNKTGDFYSSGDIKVQKLGTDSLEIFYLGTYKVDTISVKAKVDWTTGQFTIDPQLMYVSANYGECNIVSVVSPTAGTYSTTGKVTGTISDDCITLSPWACLIMGGTYKGYVLGTFYSKTIIRDYNATMTGQELSEDSVAKSFSDPVYIEQTSTNQLKVYNFAGVSCCINIDVRGNKSMQITPQSLFSQSKYGVFYCYKADWNANVYYTKERIQGSAADNKLSWGNWVINTSNGKYRYRRFINTEIALPFTLSYPATQTQQGFKGSGTESDPYLIENAADLLALSDSVNMTPADTLKKYALAYEGKYFKQTANINMKGYNFPPIGGNDEYYRFGGTYDGGNKTISYLNTETGALGYCALFGAVDTVGTIKNLKLTAPTSKAQYYYTGTVAAWCQGTIDNCSVTGASVDGLYCVGGVAAICYSINNSSFINGTVIGNNQVGGVVGVTRGPSSKLYSTGSTVTATSANESSSVGGLAGWVSYQRGGKLSDSYFSGTVHITYSGEYAGLISGIAVASTIERCFAIGEITHEERYSSSALGGIVGATQNATITDCYFAGDINTGVKKTGHILGYTMNASLSGYPDHTTIRNCYATGYTRLTTKSGDYNPYLGYYEASSIGSAPVIENCKFDAQLIPFFKDYSGATTTAKMTDGTAWDGFSTDYWTFTAGSYPSLNSYSSTTASKVSVAPMTFSSDEQTVDGVSANFTLSTTGSVTWKAKINGTLSTTGKGINIDKTNAYLNGSFATDTLYAQNGKLQRWVIIKTSPANKFEGEGTAEKPYLIKTKQDLITLSEGTTSNKLTYDGTHFLICNDIDMEYDEAFKGISAVTSSVYGFGGTLDGGNHTIHRCKLHFAGLGSDGKVLSTHEGQRGFVGYMKATGTVKNLRMAADCDLVFYSQSGSMVGYNNGGLIENCRNYANVTAYSGTSGGICGYLQKGGVIRDCYNSGRVVCGYQYASGIAAFNYGLIENCQNDGEVTLEKLSNSYSETKFNSVSGICHSILGEGQARNVLNTGYIHGYKYVGGISALYNNSSSTRKTSIVGALNLGMLDITTTTAADANTIGNIMGKHYKDADYEGVYYDAQVSTHSAAHGASHAGITAATTAQLTSGDSLQGLSREYWHFEKGKYPMLRTFMDEEGARAAAASVVDFGTSVRSDSIKTDATLYKTDSLAWTVVTGKAFAVEGATLLMDPADVLTDTLVATYGNFQKRIPVVAVPDSLSAPVITLSTDGGKNVVIITTAQEGTTVYYTIGGTAPTTSSSVYPAAGVEITDAGDITVKAFATKHNFYPSAISEATFTLTGIQAVDGSRNVVSRGYISASGAEASTPFNGLNIVVTTYDDGSRSVEKRYVRMK